MTQDRDTSHNLTPARSAMFLYVGNVMNMVLGYLYWMIVANIADTQVVGLASASLSLVTIFTGFASLGIATGSQRFLGQANGSSNRVVFISVLRKSLLLTLASTIMICAIILASSSFILSTYGAGLLLAIIIATTVLFSALTPIFQASLTSLGRTREVAIGSIVSSISKIAVGASLVAFGLGSEGVLLGVLIMYVLSLLFFSLSTLKRIDVALPKLAVPSSDSVTASDILRAGMPSWIPGLIQSVGTQVGILLVFGSVGAEQTGLYYMALNIYMVLLAVPSSIMGFLFPYISGMSKRGHLAIERGLRFVLVCIMPVVAVILAYPALPLVLFGSQYTSASDILRVLILSLPFVSLSLAVTTYAYSLGRYKMVFLIGFSTNSIRVILYLLLTPIYGGLGAASAFLGGAIIGGMVSIVASLKLGMSLKYTQLGQICVFPIVLAFIVSQLSVFWILNMLVILILTTIVFARKGLILKSDVILVIESVFPSATADKVIHRIRFLMSIFKEDSSSSSRETDPS